MSEENGRDKQEWRRVLRITVTESSRLDDASARALAYDGPALVEVVADPELV